MQFKIHLLIISVIIIAVYIIAHIFNANKLEPIEASALPVVHKSGYTITIENASWGMNCKNTPQPEQDEVRVENPIALTDNNVIYPVSRLCNGNSRCEIPVDSNTLGEPMRSCFKLLEVEYRCFNIDKLRKAKSSSGVLAIDCDQLLIPNAP